MFRISYYVRAKFGNSWKIEDKVKDRVARNTITVANNKRIRYFKANSKSTFRKRCSL